MVEQESVALRQIWRKWYKPALDALFKEFESAGIRLTPDAAIEEMEGLFKSVLDRSESASESELKDNALNKMTFRFDDVAMTCEAHHYAVDLFYKYYFPRIPGSTGKARRGGTRLSETYLDEILKLHRQRKNPAQIAHLLGQPTDRVRHQVKIAEQRYREAIERVQQLGASQWARNITSESVPKPLIHARKRRHRSKPRATPN